MNNLAFYEWINSFPDYIGKDEGEIFVISRPSDMEKVHERLFEILGE